MPHRPSLSLLSLICGPLSTSACRLFLFALQHVLRFIFFSLDTLPHKLPPECLLPVCLSFSPCTNVVFNTTSPLEASRTQRELGPGWPHSPVVTTFRGSLGAEHSWGSGGQSRSTCRSLHVQVSWRPWRSEHVCSQHGASPQPARNAVHPPPCPGLTGQTRVLSDSTGSQPLLRAQGSLAGLRGRIFEHT